MPQQTRDERRFETTHKLFTKDAFSCALLLALCLLVIWPVAEIGINDDWSYILTTQAFVHTHHFIYNGWATAMLGWQVFWGALFAQLLRPDFVGIRLATIPIALLTAILFHAILRNFGMNRAHALFGTLTLTLNPLFLSLSATFMTDIPALLVVLLCVYLCQRALAAQDDIHAVLWLAAAALTNLGLGTVRQVTWLGLLIIVPCCAWLMRRRRYVVPATIVLWIVGVISIKLLIAWFFRHPYSIPLRLFPKTFDAVMIWGLFKNLGQLTTTSLLLTLPLLVTGIAAQWPPKRRQMLGAFAVVLILGTFYVISKRIGVPALADSFWTGNILTPYGIMQGADLFHSSHRISPIWAMGMFILVVLCTISFVQAIYRPRTLPAVSATSPEISWYAMNVLLLPFLACYLVLLFPLAFIVLFDRYLLEIVAVLLIYMLRWHQERISPRIPAIATATLVVVALLGVAGTHDLFTMARAEVRLTNAMQQAGIPRTEIRGGFDYDTVTEVYTAGYLNDPHLVNPPGSFQPLRTDESGPCGDPFLVYLPAMNIKYEVASGPSPCTVPTDFPAQIYRTWLPPARRELYVVTRKPREGATPKP